MTIAHGLKENVFSSIIRSVRPLAIILSYISTYKYVSYYVTLSIVISNIFCSPLLRGIFDMKKEGELTFNFVLFHYIFRLVFLIIM